MNTDTTLIRPTIRRSAEHHSYRPRSIQQCSLTMPTFTFKPHCADIATASSALIDGYHKPRLQRHQATCLSPPASSHASTSHPLHPRFTSAQTRAYSKSRRAANSPHLQLPVQPPGVLQTPLPPPLSCHKSSLPPGSQRPHSRPSQSPPPAPPPPFHPTPSHQARPSPHLHQSRNTLSPSRY